MRGLKIFVVMPHLLIHLGALLGVNVRGIDREGLFLALYKRAKYDQSGIICVRGDFQYEGSSHAWARQWVGRYADKVGGKVMRITVPGDGEDEMDTYYYNHENGFGAAEEIVEQFRAEILERSKSLS